MSPTESFDDLEQKLSELVQNAIQQVKDEFKEKLKATRAQVEEVVSGELSAARDQVATAQADAVQTAETVAAAEARANEASESLAAAETRMTEMSEALEAAEGRAIDTSGSLEASEARADEAVEALEAAEARINDLAEDLEAAQARAAELTDALGIAETTAAEATDAAAAAPSSDLLGRIMEALSEVDTGRTQAEVLQGLLTGAGDFSSRTALFLTGPDGLRGWGHRGFGSGSTEFDQIVVDYSEGSAHTRLVEGRGVVQLSEEDCVVICERIDGSRPRSGVLIPIVLANRLAAAVYADQLDETEVDVQALQLLSYLAGQALETLPVREGGSTVTLQLATEAVVEQPGLELWDFDPPVVETEPAVAENVEEVVDHSAAPAIDEIDLDKEDAGDAVESKEHRPAEDSGFAVEISDDGGADVATAIDDEVAPEIEPIEEFADAIDEATEAEFVAEPVEAEPIEMSPVEETYEAAEEIEAVEEAEEAEEAVVEPEVESEGSAEVMPPSPAAGAQVSVPDDLEGPGWAFQTRNLGGEEGEDSSHEEARRLARLLVTEIKLYNEEQVEEGRRNRNVYQTLREDIDRSRQIYEERVDEDVRTRTDYFHDELVRILAAGEAEVLGV